MPAFERRWKRASSAARATGSSAVGSQPTGPIASDQRYVSSGAHGPVGGTENYYTAPKYTA